MKTTRSSERARRHSSIANGARMRRGIESAVAVYLPDTSVLIDALNDKRGRSESLSELVEAGHMLASCPVTVAEVFAGMHESEAEQTAELIDRLEFFELTPEISRKAGRLNYDWARKGITLGLADVMLAATVLHHELVLITDNEKHFPMPELVMHRLEGFLQ